MAVAESTSVWFKPYTKFPEENAVECACLMMEVSKIANVLIPPIAEKLSEVQIALLKKIPLAVLNIDEGLKRQYDRFVGHQG